MSTVQSWLIAASLAAACRMQPSPASFASQEAAIASLTMANTGWHLGTRADCTNSFLNQMIAEDSAYQPYEVRADFNQDGLQDLAFALVKADSGRIYWLRAHAKGFDQPQLVGTVDWIDEGGLVARDGLLIFGMFYSDVSFTWEWHSASGKLEFLPTDSVSEN